MLAEYMGTFTSTRWRETFTSLWESKKRTNKAAKTCEMANISNNICLLEMLDKYINGKKAPTDVSRGQSASCGDSNSHFFLFSRPIHHPQGHAHIAAFVSHEST